MRSGRLDITAPAGLINAKQTDESGTDGPKIFFRSPYIAVPDSSYSLYYSSVQPSGDVVNFQADNGSSTSSYSADCRAGTLNGSTPQSASEAQLVNAACQVAFGQ